MAALTLLFAGPWGPLIIFALRVVDVSLDTVRMLLAMRNARAIVPVLAFVQVLIWITAVGNAIRNLDSLWHVLGYAAGFATGNLVGLWLEERLAYGWATVRIISKVGGVELAEALRERGFGVTEFAGQGRDGMVEVVYTVLRRRQIPQVFEEVDVWDPNAFVTVEEPRMLRSGWLRQSRPRRKWLPVRV